MQSRGLKNQGSTKAREKSTEIRHQFGADMKYMILGVHRNMEALQGAHQLRGGPPNSLL
jgi:hypothetical protein